MERTIDGDCRYLIQLGKTPAEQQLPVSPLVTTPAVTYQDEWERTLLLCGSPQNAWDCAAVTLKVEPTLSDIAFADRFANPSQCCHAPSWS